MTLSTINDDAHGDYLTSPKVTEYQYDLRLEIGVKKENETIPVVEIFHDFVQRMKNSADPGTAITVLTTADKEFRDDEEMKSEEFQKAFQVEEKRGKMPKVMLGFKLRTTAKMSDIKKRLMNTFLIPNNLFLREHTGGFHHGVTSYMYGYLQDEHPDHPDLQALSKRILRICKDSWKDVEKDDKIKWRDEFPNLHLGDNFPILPIRFTKERIAAIMEGKDRIVTHALMISTPSKYGAILKTVMSLAVLKKRITNLIPFALGREDPTGYYNLIAAQARFMEGHRNIPISSVPENADKSVGAQGKSLFQVLTGNPKIQRVAYDPKTNQYHVSTRSHFYRETHHWITNVLEQHKFDYKPMIKKMRFDYSTTGSKTSMYADIFKDAISVAAETQDTNTVKTARGNAWTQRPPLAISYVKSNEAFPSLTTTKSPATQSTASETFDEETIQTAISSAIKKLEAQYQAELTKMRQEFRTDLDAMKDQMQNMAQLVATKTYQALTNADGPLATKAEFEKIEHRQSIQETQLATIIGLLKGQHSETMTSSRAQITAPTASPPRQAKRNKPTLTPIKKNLCTEVFCSTQSTERKQLTTDDQIMSQDSFDDNSVPSATSNPFEDMEGCEE